MLLYPKLYVQKVTDITVDMIKKNNIQGIILDVDNTLIDYNRNFLEGIDSWCEQMKAQGIKFCIASNSNKKEKVRNVAKRLNIPYVFFATKPFKRGLLKAKRRLGLNAENIAVVGDQIFTDVIGANRCHMFPILTKPLAEKDILITVLKRPIENYIIKKYQEK